jgi:hypothetical protein
MAVWNRTATARSSTAWSVTATAGAHRESTGKCSSQRRDASACCQSVPQPTTSACPERPLNVLCLGVSCQSSRLVRPPATTLRTLMDSSRRTGAAIADGRPEVATLT